MTDRYTPPSSPEEAAERMSAELGTEVFTTPDGERALRTEGTSLAVLKAVAGAMSRGAFTNGYGKAVDVIREPFSDLLPADVGTYESSGQDAAERLSEAIDAAAEEGYRIFGRELSRYEWLWMIRRLPLRHGWTPEGANTIRIMMSTLALSSNRTPGSFPPDGIIDVSRHQAVRLTYLLGYTEALGQLMRAYRWVCKGGTVRINFQGKSINVEKDKFLRETLKLYDKRAYEGASWGGFGVPFSNLAGIRPFEAPLSKHEVLLVFPRREGKWSSNRPDAALARYADAAVDLKEFLTLLELPSSPDTISERPELFSLAALLRSMALLIERGHLEGEAVRFVGYSVHGGSPEKREDLVPALSDGLQWAREALSNSNGPGSVEELVRELQSCAASMSPLYAAPVLFSIEDGFIADWHAASARFMANLRLTSEGGEFASLRGPVFEQWVQEQIAETGREPPSWLASLVNRQLAVDGEVIGEFDAAATLPGGQTHYLIECKSYVYSDEYEVGSHATIRNIDERLTSAADRIVGLAVQMMERGEGDNWTVPEGHVFLPLVLTPRVMYSSSTLCWKRCPDTEWGLRLVSSASEFLNLMDGLRGSDS